MDQNQNGKPTTTGGTSTPLQTNSSNQVAGSSAFSPYLREQYAHQYFHHIQQQQLQQKLQQFWANKRREVEQTTDFRDHSLPLARIKKIMKADEDVKMISAEAPIIMAKACETFVMALTMRAWVNAGENKRRTLQKSDIAAAIAENDVFDFLVDVVPRSDCSMDHDLYAGIRMGGGNNVPSENVPYYYKAPHRQVVGPTYGPPGVSFCGSNGD